MYRASQVSQSHMMIKLSPPELGRGSSRGRNRVEVEGGSVDAGWVRVVEGGSVDDRGGLE